MASAPVSVLVCPTCQRSNFKAKIGLQSHMRACTGPLPTVQAPVQPILQPVVQSTQTVIVRSPAEILAQLSQAVSKAEEARCGEIEYSDCESEAEEPVVESESESEESDAESECEEPQVVEESDSDCESESDPEEPEQSSPAPEESSPASEALFLENLVNDLVDSTLQRAKETVADDQERHYAEQPSPTASEMQEYWSDDDYSRPTPDDSATQDISNQTAGDAVDTFADCKIICKTCQMHADPETAEIICFACSRGDFQVKKTQDLISTMIKKEESLGEILCDLRPVRVDKRVVFYAPTESNPRRYVDLKTLKFQTLEEKTLEIPLGRYKDTVTHINYLYKLRIMQTVTEPTDWELSSIRGSLFANRELTDDEVLYLYARNPQVRDSKPFYQKLALDYDVKYSIREYTKVFVDIETSCCDGQYMAIPTPDIAQHQITMIQMLFQSSTNAYKPEVHIFYRTGYTFNEEELRAKYTDVELHFASFSVERTMVDAFWSKIATVNTQIVLTGFNAVHQKQLYKPEENSQDVDKLKLYFEKTSKVYGYDMGWLVNRSSFRLTAKSHPFKVSQDTTTMCTQLQELPNVVMMDYQGLCVQKMPQKAKNKLDDETLGSVLKALFGDQLEQVDTVSKIKQDAVQLQRITHQRMNAADSTVDMTKEFDYAINDVVCLMRCEDRCGYITDITTNQMEVSNIGFRCGYELTTAQVISIDVSRQRLRRGLSYKLVATRQVCKNPDGAYTSNHDEYTGKVVEFIIQDDYNSLYPSVIRAYNISPDTFKLVTTDPTPYADATKYAVIEVSDDKTFKHETERSYAVYTRDFEGIMPELCRNLTDRRKAVQTEMKQFQSSEPQYKRLDQLQNALKLKNNTIYGCSGAMSNPYFQHIVAVSVTSAARNCLAQLNRGVAARHGYMDGIPLAASEPMYRVDDQKGERDESGNLPQLWVRNYYDKQSGAVSRVVQNDTDAAFYRVGDLEWFYKARAEPQNQAMYYEAFHKGLEDTVAQFLGNSSILKFACEEFIVALISAKAKKSYMRLDIKSIPGQPFQNVYIDIMNQIRSTSATGEITFNKDLIKTLEKQGVMEVTIKGVAWTRFHIEMRTIIRELFLDILLTNEVAANVERYKVKLMSEYLERMELYVNGDQSQRQYLEHFATRTRTSGKTPLIQHIKRTYKIESDTVYLLPLRQQYKGQKKSTRAIPIEYVTKANRHLIHDEAILDTFQSQINKFFSADKTSKAKAKRDEAVEELDETQILMRHETVKSRQAGYQAINVDELEAFLKEQTRDCFHETIHQDVNKLFFDIDKHKLDLPEFKNKVRRVLQQLDVNTDDLQMYVAYRQDTSKYHSYHITFNVVCPLEFTRTVAERVRNAYKTRDDKVVAWMDTAPYAINKTLRLPYSLKINDKGKVDKTSMLICDNELKHSLITYVADDSYQFIATPLCLSTKPIIAFTTKPRSLQIEGITTIPALQEALSALLFTDGGEDDFYRYASVRRGHLCPACQKPHASDSDRKVSVLYRTHDVSIKCFRNNVNGQPAHLHIPYNKEDLKKLKMVSKDLPINTTTQFASSLIPNQDKQYVEFDLSSSITYVKSNMGTGKTEQLIRFLPEYLELNSAVMLSTRQTLSTEWCARYRRAGIKIVDYRERPNTLHAEPGEILVVQVDSLCRLSLEGVGLLILDEVQSIISQLNSSQLRDKTAVDSRFVELVKSADKVLCMDASLQETTMDLINYIRQEDGRLFWNARKSYEHVNVTIRKFGKGIDHILEHFKDRVITQNKNVIGHINSFSKAEKVVKYLRGLKPDLRIKFYHGEDKMTEVVDGQTKYHSAVKQADLKNVGEVWSEQQVVIYTGTISAGIDYNREHFHENISVFSSRANSADQFMQGLMRCRKLIDNHITVYVQDISRCSSVSLFQVYQDYTRNMQSMSVGSNSLLSNLFNLQLYIEAYTIQQEVRPVDIIIATLNLMGMKLRYEALTQAQMDKKTIAKDIKSSLPKISAELLKSQTGVQLHSCEVFLSHADQEKQEALLRGEPNEQLATDLVLLSFVSTVYNQHMRAVNALETAESLQKSANESLRQLAEASDKDRSSLVAEFILYEPYRNNYKVFESHGQHLVQMAPELAEQHIQQLVINHDLQYRADMRVRNNKLQNVQLAKHADEMRQALKFYHAFAIDPQSEDTKQAAAALKKTDVRARGYIFQMLGLNYTRTEDAGATIQHRSNGKILKTRTYDIEVKPFFSDKILLKLRETVAPQK